MQTAESKNCVLDQDAIVRKLRRLALEVAEQNSDEDLVILAGVEGNGQVVARALAKELESIGAFRIAMLDILLDKKDPLTARFKEKMDLEDKVVVLVDDVANTGKTLLYALKPFLDAHPKKIQTLVLVERSHKLFPVQTDYSGLSIATTLQEHIAVETSHDKITGAWLY